MAGRVILHVGAPKTGSTYLQKRLRGGAEMLRASGLYVPVLARVSRMAGNAKLLASALSDRLSHSFQRRFPGIAASPLDPAAILDDLMEGWHRSEEDIILSAENFRPNHARVLRAMMPPGLRPEVILVVRRQDDWMESYWGQLIKTGDIAMSLHEFVRQVGSIDSERIPRPDWDAHYVAWCDAFGSVSVVLYDEAKLDLMLAFMSAIGLSHLPLPPEAPRAQVALDPFALAYLFKHAGVFDLHGRRAASNAAISRLGGHGACSLLDCEDRDWIFRNFAPSNAALLKRISREDGSAHLEIRHDAKRAGSLDEIAASSGFANFVALADELYDEARAARATSPSRHQSS